MEFDLDRIKTIFFPYANERQQRVEKHNLRFVHYTKAESALRILQGKEVWLRKSSTMNDFREVRHGLECLFRSFSKSDFPSTIDKIFPGFSDELDKAFGKIIPDLEANTFIACFSEHEPDDDAHGKLSMWRAYGYGAGVALVMNTKPFFSKSTALQAYSSPVAYFEDPQVIDHLNRISKSITENQDFVVNTLRRRPTFAFFLSALTFATLSIKHRGFKEEQEWRVIYTPKLAQSLHIVPSVESINGVPQIVHKIPLKNIPEEGFEGAAIPDLIERIIIGPTAYPNDIRDAFVEALRKAGVTDAENKVYPSWLPLRC